MPICGKCHSKLEHKIIQKGDKSVEVSICPNGCGQIKSPQCCMIDMKFENKKP